MSHPPAALEALFEAAEAARAKAYAPYSRFAVGAAILTPDGSRFAGCNVENAAFPVGTCAEAGAIAAMAAAGGRLIEAIAVTGSGGEPCFPCGACRQRIREFATERTLVHLRAAQGTAVLSFTLAELLPHAFGPDNLPGQPQNHGSIA